MIVRMLVSKHDMIFNFYSNFASLNLACRVLFFKYFMVSFDHQVATNLKVSTNLI
jgi:hypothetical protein